MSDPLWITCIVVLAALLLSVFLVPRSRPGRVRLKMTLLKLWSIEIEVDPPDKSDELPGNRPGAGGI